MVAKETEMTEISSRYLIIGGGMAADAAVRGIREGDGEGKIVLVSCESVPRTTAAAFEGAVD